MIIAYQATIHSHCILFIFIECNIYNNLNKTLMNMKAFTPVQFPVHQTL